MVSGHKVTDHSAERNEESAGLVTSDSLAAESIKQHEGGFDENHKAGISQQPSKSTTSNTTDHSNATTLESVRDASARDDEEAWTGGDGVKSDRTKRHEQEGKEQAEADANRTQKFHESEDQSHENSKDSGAGSDDKNNPSRLAEKEIVKHNSDVTSGRARDNTKVDSEGQYDILNSSEHLGGVEGETASRSAQSSGTSHTKSHHTHKDHSSTKDHSSNNDNTDSKSSDKPTLEFNSNTHTAKSTPSAQNTTNSKSSPSNQDTKATADAQSAKNAEHAKHSEETKEAEHKAMIAKRNAETNKATHPPTYSDEKGHAVEYNENADYHHVQPSAEEIEKRRTELPIPEAPPVQSDWNSMDARNVNVGA
ncbi:hypothetical protein BT63DRAFT_424055 [Microthyrium microscopicum]|uniref:Uncharacterized protein n=1 Tax=Microthyrium microscopicum TaxID=703497 RepID=A0A6A6UE51_9PEZI|nr:hypothetical protein BT63DRAFT_424055 [Microthyrium microscopicum]